MVAVVRVRGCAGELYDAYVADVWALGVSLFALLYHRLPFIATSVPAMARAVQEQACVPWRRVPWRRVLGRWRSRGAMCVHVRQAGVPGQGW